MVWKDIRYAKLYFSLASQQTFLCLELSCDWNYFSIVKPLNVGRTGDYMAAWIYIPNSITVASEDLLKLVSLVQEKIVSGVEQYDNLRPLLDSSYPDLLYIDCMPVRQTEALAYRMYGQNTDFVYLGNLLAQGLDQSYYKKYKAVFFLDIPARNEVPPSVLQQMYDLSRNGFEQPAYLFPPQTLPVAGMELFVNQVPFRDKPLKTILGSKLNILLHRTGYKDVVLAVNICKPRQSFLLQNEILWEKEINAQMFHVMFKGRLAMQYQLFVNGNLVSSDHSISIREQEARNARVEVMKPGCANYQGYLNLTQPLTHTIVLQELPIRSASHTSKSNSSVFASKKFLLGMIVYTVVVFFAGICLGDLINKTIFKKIQRCQLLLRMKYLQSLIIILILNLQNLLNWNLKASEIQIARLPESNRQINQRNKKTRRSHREKKLKNLKKKQVQRLPLRVNLFLNLQTSMLLRLIEIRIMNLQMYPHIVLRIVRKVIKKNNYKLSYYEI